jgi:hypothetical protein
MYAFESRAAALTNGAAAVPLGFVTACTSYSSEREGLHLIGDKEAS